MFEASLMKLRVFRALVRETALCQAPPSFDEMYTKVEPTSTNTFVCRNNETNKLYFAKRPSEGSLELARCQRIESPYVMKCYLQVGDLLLVELLKGPDLLLATAEGKEQSPDGTPWSHEEIMILSRDILLAISDVHSCEILHLDLKPENIVFVHEEGPTNVRHDQVNVKLCDFDASRDIREKTPISRGTARYLPPEVLEGHVPDAKTDVWSAGVVMFFLITGELLICTDDDAEVLRMLRSAGFLESRLSNIETPFKHILIRLLDEDPNRRPSAREALSMVQSALEGSA